MENKVSESHRAANDRYDAKTYEKITFRIRKQDDSDILKSIAKAKKLGLNNREWLRSIFDAAQSK